MKSRPNDRFGIIITEGLQHPPQPHTIPSSCLRFRKRKQGEGRNKSSSLHHQTTQLTTMNRETKRMAKNGSECEPDYTCRTLVKNLRIREFVNFTL